MDNQKSITGWYYGADSSKRQQATLTLFGDNFCQLDGEELSKSFELSSTEISERIGNSPRSLTFDDGSQFETTANDFVDQLYELLPQAKGSSASLLYKLESRWTWILTSFIFVVFFIYLFITQGIPFTAKVIADHTPEQISASLGANVMRALDGNFMEPSSLTDEEQEALREELQPLLNAYSDLPVTIHFRSSNMGANAFALPSGDVVFTDDLINLATDTQQILAVAAHEIGHVQHRHGLQHIVKDGMTYWIVALVFGDFGGVAEIIAAAPAVLLSAGYSREMEREADEFAKQAMTNNDIPLHHFADILEKLSAQHDIDLDNDALDTAVEYTSSHPPTNERIEAFRKPKE